MYKKEFEMGRFLERFCERGGLRNRGEKTLGSYSPLPDNYSTVACQKGRGAGKSHLHDIKAISCR